MSSPGEWKRKPRAQKSHRMIVEAKWFHEIIHGQG
jgi:hypothetical protein